MTGDDLITLPTAIQHMTSLRELNLANNPLGIVPDVSKMPDLALLLLSDTGISEWPAGLFAQPRNEAFILELRGNPITTVPIVASNSESAIVIALTRPTRHSMNRTAQ
ncbi:hypothetical protein [Pseudomonas sp. TAE6080]|uniref:hypothetical protein n=1 Tax=Pseudomonas sp. TAE6080 TaxID=2840374 RepID=UPI0020786193